MKTKYSLFGILAAITLVVSLIVPGNLAAPAPASADAGICKWNYIDMPGSVYGKGDLLIDTANSAGTGAVINQYEYSEVIKLVATANGDRFLAAVNRTFGGQPNTNGTTSYPNIYFYTSGANKGISWSGLNGNHLMANYAAAYPGQAMTNGDTWNIATAPDDPSFWAVVTGTPTVKAPVNVWITTNAGATWENTQLDVATSNATVGSIVISPTYGGKRDIAVGIRTSTDGGALRIYVLQSGGFTGWKPQTVTGLFANGATAVANADVLALKFSPTYVGDASLAVVFSMPSNAGATDIGTFYNVAIRDISSTNNIAGWAFPKSVEVKNSAAAMADSPDLTTIVSADLELPSDFSGQSASLRRAYISLDAAGAAAPNRSGIFRIDDTTVYELMDTTGQGTNGKRIASIAYFGTYASGKLLAGEFNGQACTATVPTWFTDSPTVCPVPCWYPALKPTTGAAGQDCNTSTIGVGNAQVLWSNDGTLAYAATSSLAEQASAIALDAWFALLDNTPTPRDESAIAISRNNGETWNQIGVIDTYIAFFNDVAITADCQTIYLASSNNWSASDCDSFDSVWRTTKNSKIAAPFSTANPLGYFWERIFTHVTATSCNVSQTDLPLLRLPPPGANCDNGMVIGWAAQGTKAQAWSPDYGDYWAMITPRNNVQDFSFESATLLYNLSSSGLVQKMPYTGTAWSSAEADVDTTLLAGHSILAWPEGKVAVGTAASQAAAGYPAAMSVDSAKTFIPIMDQSPSQGDFHVAFDPAFDTNKTWYIADESSNGTVYRVTYPGMGTSLTDVDMMSGADGAIGTMAPHPVGIYGLQTAYTGGALYAAHDPTGESNRTTKPIAGNSGVDRTLWPLDGMPKPGIVWDEMFVDEPTNYENGVTFTRQPWSLKICGCCTLDTNSKLWALDARGYIPYFGAGWSPYQSGYGMKGFLWGFEDCLAKKGPSLITKDGELIGCDPVSGRAQEVNLCWEQLCVANGYDIEIAKDKGFTIRVLDWAISGLAPDSTVTTNSGTVTANTVSTDMIGYWHDLFLHPVDVLKPCVFFPAGGVVNYHTGSSLAYAGNLECGHQYFWRVQVRECATQELLRSYWSEVRSFTIKAGLPVRADYYGLKLLAPDNGCLGCPVKPASFSWSPFKETIKYKFVLAKDAAMTQVVAEAEVPTTAYEYKGNLDYSTNYFWRVMSLAPAPSDWSATFSFQTEAAPAAPTAPAEAPATPLWVWVIIAIGAILVIVTLVLIFKTRRV